MGVRSPGAGVAGTCKLPNIGAGNKLTSSGRAANTPKFAEPSLQPRVFNCILRQGLVWNLLSRQGWST